MKPPKRCTCYCDAQVVPSSKQVCLVVTRRFVHRCVLPAGHKGKCLFKYEAKWRV
jgi:hypothetical protein